MGIRRTIDDAFYYGKQGFIKLWPSYALGLITLLFMFAGAFSIHNAVVGIAMFVGALISSWILTGYLED